MRPESPRLTDPLRIQDQDPDGAELEAGDELTEGSVNPHDILKIKGLRAVQDYMIQEVTACIPSPGC